MRTRSPKGGQMYFISQVGKHDCAFACLEMMLANYHHDKNYLFLKHEDKLYSFKELIAVGESFNLKLLGVKIENVNELIKCRTFPIIATLKVKDNARHSVLIYRVNKQKVYFYDPARGKMTMSLREFDDKWSKNALIAEKPIRYSCPIIPPTFIAPRDKITLPLYQVLSGISLLVGSYFIDRDALILIPIIFFSLFIIFELLFRENLIRAMQRMDEEIAKYELDITCEEYYSLFEATEKYRENAVAFVPNIIFTMLITAFMTVVLIMNGTINLIYVILSFLFAGVESVILEPYFDRQVKAIEDDEREIKNSQNEDEFRHFSSYAREKAYHLGLTKTVLSYLTIGLMLIITILIMALTESINVTYVVFFLCISIFLKGNFNKMFKFTSQEEKCDLYRSKIIHSLKIEQ